MIFLRKKNKAFTILEMIIVFFFISALSTIVLMNYNKDRDSVQLLNSTKIFTQNIRTAQVMVGTEEINCKIEEIHHDDYSYGYGIYITEDKKDSYLIFADCDGNKLYDENVDIIIKEVSLEKSIKIDYFNPKVDNSLHLVFSPPNKTFINNSAEEAEIILYIENEPNETQTIKINKVGRIEVNN